MQTPRSMRQLVLPGLIGLSCLAAAPAAQAQSFLPFGFNPLPAFAWTEPDPATGSMRWEGSFARMSTGFQVSSSKRFGTYAGPTVGFEGGKMWRDGQFVYGIVGGFDYMAQLGGRDTPSFGSIGYTRDFAGGIQFKAGALVADNVLVYTKVGALAINETYRYGPTPFSTAFDRTRIAVRPDARVGVEWAVTDKLTIGLEAGVTGAPIR
ncbi:outer membrane protein [Enterovirga rhinocerotis]|uniref:Opacity protein-like surface antigen n=1 Tax=Enterovirga rhinocerotis TaxID=1339210 RepID=A0A4R7C859_9HYPH|nr:hypothetical protein [Enterovirga rhinocerotis]TDR94800.1 hypothetical protein EV668_2089 [Enterovirga rhinocerotis]